MPTAILFRPMPMNAQLPLDFPQRGGKRAGSGRKRKSARALVPHRSRTELSSRHPVHVTMRALPEIPSLRAMNRAVRQALIAGAKKDDFRLIHYAILSNHLHLIVEADDAKSLSRGIQGLAIRIAWAVNRVLRRKRGKVFSDRYHDHQLKNPRETRAALHYVLCNYRKHLAEHGRMLPPDFIDEHCSTARYLHHRDPENCPLPSPDTWFLQRGYREHGGGEIDLSRTPGRRPRDRRRIERA